VEFEDNRRVLVEVTEVEAVSRRSAKGKSSN